MNDQKSDNGEASVNVQSSTTPETDLGASSAIGRRLKAYYDDVASEPVPDKFLSLLDALDAAASKSQPRD